MSGPKGGFCSASQLEHTHQQTYIISVSASACDCTTLIGIAPPLRAYFSKEGLTMFSSVIYDADCAASSLIWRSSAIFESCDPGLLLKSRCWARSALGFASHSTMQAGLTQQTFALTNGFTCMPAHCQRT